jgi:hypothetical protein
MVIRARSYLIDGNGWYLFSTSKRAHKWTLSRRMVSKRKSNGFPSTKQFVYVTEDTYGFQVATDNTAYRGYVHITAVQLKANKRQI